MTRLTSIAALLFALVALPGCPDDNTNTDDMTVSTGDMAVKPDAATPGSCAAFLACSTPCTTSMCIDTCAAAVLTGTNVMAQAALSAVATCQGTHCLNDGGATDCSGGTATSGCKTCVATMCGSQITACMAH